MVGHSFNLLLSAAALTMGMQKTSKSFASLPATAQQDANNHQALPFLGERKIVLPMLQ